MLIVPQDDNHLRLMGFDPGTDTLGTCVLDVDLRTMRAGFVDAQTFTAQRPLRYAPEYQSIQETHGDRHARLMAHRDAVSAHVHTWRPHAVACESPFMARHAQAFEALVECMNTIRMAVYEFDPSIGFETITPPQAKRTVGASFKGAGKEAVAQGVWKLIEVGDVDYLQARPFTSLDEHTTDAMAVVLCHYQQWLEYLKH